MHRDKTLMIACGDSRVLVPKMPKECVDLLIADFPWGFSNNAWDISTNEFVALVEDIIPKFFISMKEGASAYLYSNVENIGEVASAIKKAGLAIDNLITVVHDLGYHPKVKFKARSDFVFFCGKGKRKTFNADAVRIPQETNDKRNNSLGAVPPDVWHFSEVRKNSKEYLGHKGQKPEALIERMILASSNENDVIFDPFSGTFTTGKVALQNNRKFIGFEKEEQWCQIGLERILATRNVEV